MLTWLRRSVASKTIPARRKHRSTGSLSRNQFRPRLELLEGRTLLSPGDLDPTFGTGGRVTTSFAGRLDAEAKAVALQSDGKIVIAGVGPFVLARYNADGSLDPTFGNGGTASATSGRTALAIQSDGRIVASGIINPEQDIAVTRYNVNGTLDLSFGGTGTVTNHLLQIPQRRFVTGMALQPDGRIVIAATDVLTRYNPDGSLDSSFGSRGAVTNSFNITSGVALQSDGKIVVSGSLVLARYNPDGSLDSGFGTGGQVTVGTMGDGTSVAGVVVQPDGKILVGGSRATFRFGAPGILLSFDANYTLTRYNANGSRDTSFIGENGPPHGEMRGLALANDGTIVAVGGIVSAGSVGGIFDGTTVANISLARYASSGALLSAATDNSLGVTSSGVVQADGRIVVVGHEVDETDPPTHRIGLARFTAGNVLDPTFGTAGKVVTTLMGPVATTIDAALLQPDGKFIVLDGPTAAPTRAGSCGIIRYNADGSLDQTFGNAGRLPATPPRVSCQSFTGAIQPDGKILVAVSGLQPDFSPAVAIARYNPDGSLDPTFGTAGAVVGSFGGVTRATQVALQSDGKILVAGLDRSTLALVRLNADGSQDTSFVANISAIFPEPIPSAIVGGAFALQKDGRILLSIVKGNSTSGLVRFNATGSLDTSFGNGGIVRVPFRFDSVRFDGKVRLQADGKIIVVAPGMLARYNSNGTLDTTFGDAATVAATRLGFPPGTVLDVVVQPDGRILAGGRAAPSTMSLSVIALARLAPNGTLDASFGTRGIATADLLGVSPVSLLLQPNGRLVAVGNIVAIPQIGLARFLGDDRITNDSQRYVTQVYLDLLQRPVDPSGLTLWAGLLDHGVARTSVVLAIEASREHRTLVVQGLYNRLLGRAPEPGGLNGFLDRFERPGVTAEQLEALILGSDEYFSRHGGSNTGFLQALYVDTLQRPIDDGGAQIWNQALSQGASRTAVATAVLASLESDRLEVQALYPQFLHRNADGGGLDAFTAALQRGVPNELILALLVGSDEYFGRL